MLPKGKSALGQYGEKLAASFLRYMGYRVLHLNWRKHRFEIDIIAQNEKLLLFIEVKTLRNSTYGLPENQVNKLKARHLHDAADYYLEENPWNGEVRFDIMAIITGDKHTDKPKIRYIKDAILPFS